MFSQAGRCCVEPWGGSTGKQGSTRKQGQGHSEDGHQRTKSKGGVGGQGIAWDEFWAAKTATLVLTGIGDPGEPGQPAVGEVELVKLGSIS